MRDMRIRGRLPRFVREQCRGGGKEKMRKFPTAIR